MTISIPSMPQDEQDILDAFHRCPEFAVFSEKETSLLLRLVETEEYHEGQQVFAMNQTGKSFYIVAYGKLSLRLKSNDYKQCKAGDIFGEIAVFSEKHRLGTIIALEPSKLVVFNSEKLLNPEILPPGLILKLVKALTKKMITYFYRGELLSSAEMIRRGENECVEFKASMTKKVREPVVRTLSAFMNLNGGTLFIGVNDDGTIQGIEATTTDFDKFELNTRSLIRYKLGTYFNNMVHFAVEPIEGKKILRIDCDSSRSPVFFKRYNNSGEEMEEFVVRTGAANTHLKKGSEIIAYYQRRYKG